MQTVDAAADVTKELVDVCLLVIQETIPAYGSSYFFYSAEMDSEKVIVEMAAAMIAAYGLSYSSSSVAEILLVEITVVAAVTLAVNFHIEAFFSSASFHILR